MKYFSLFSGIGGFELGFPRTWKCAGFSEVDKHAIGIYQSHFRRHIHYGDITKINPTTLPHFDLLCGGFPCQSFSIAGKRGGFADTRGTLFFEIARLAADKRPRLLLLENVKGLLSHDFGLTFETIVETLDELGYDLQWQVLNSKNFGVPQNRERVFIVGNLRGTNRPQVFPIEGRNPIHLQEITQGVSDAQRIYDPCGVGKTLKGLGGGLGAKTGLYALRIPEATKKGYAEARIGDSINLSVLNSKTRRECVGAGVALTLDTGMRQHTLPADMRIRRLTPTECERLQGFPDNWTAGISDTQRYKCLGNAVTVNVIREIARRLQ
jgi:DNA (cytosine-5)-methyltransferase 1